MDAARLVTPLFPRTTSETANTSRSGRYRIVRETFTDPVRQTIVVHVRFEPNGSPLKLYVYFALGVPVVTTEVANISDIAPHVSVARTHTDFIAATEKLLRGKAKTIDAAERAKVLKRVSWSSRVDDILDCIRL